MPTCLNCGHTITGNYCSHCGQKLCSEKDKSIRNLFEEAFHFVTHFEGKFLTSLRTILLNPGKVSSDFNNGIRIKYYRPVSFYLVIVVIYLLFPLFPGLNMELKFYQTNPLFGTLAKKQLEIKKESKLLTDSELTAKFHRQSEATAKVLLILLIPMVAVVLYFTFRNKGIWLFDSFVLAAEINSYYILVFYLLIPPLLIGFSRLIPISVSDSELGFVFTFIFFIYLTILFRKLFKEKWWITCVKALVFNLLYGFLVQFVYKFIVFEVTMFFI